MIFSRFKWNSNTILELEKPLTAFIYYRNKRFNLLTGFSETFSIETFVEKLDELKLQSTVLQPLVFHFYYEYGFITQGLGHLLDDECPLVIQIEYEVSQKVTPQVSHLKNIPLKSLERPTWSEYKTTFSKIQQELLLGNCYQVNLTYPYDFMTAELFDPRDIGDYFFSRSGIGPFGHCTFFNNEMILSNSPECLFSYRDQEISVMPIKGTIKRNEVPAHELWQRMLGDKKEEGELLMITDLLKNDLNRMDTPTARVKKLRAPLWLPELLHQYSLISLKLQNPVSLARTMECLFPGGSITGAPKKRVMEIIANLERFRRGIYCGSTLLCIEGRKVSSINIRTAAIDLEARVWRYGAGGGITLLSRPLDEFHEMESKVSSFLTLLN